MNEREDTAHGPYTKLIGAEILAKDYSNNIIPRPPTLRPLALLRRARTSLTDPTGLYGKDVRAGPWRWQIPVNG